MDTAFWGIVARQVEGVSDQDMVCHQGCVYRCFDNSVWRVCSRLSLCGSELSGVPRALFMSPGTTPPRKGEYENRKNQEMGDRGVQPCANSGISKGEGLSSQVYRES